MRRTQTHRSKRSALGVVLLTATATLTACGSERSVASFCDTLAKGQSRMEQRYRDAVAKAQTDPLGELLGGVQNIGEMTNMLSGLASVAPDEIRTDAETVRDSWKESATASGDLDPKSIIGNLAASLVNGAEASPSYERLDAFAKNNCGSSIF